MINEFILANWIMIVGALVFVAVLAAAYKAGHRERVKQIILSLVVQAEKSLGSGTGELKYAMVVERIHGVMPPMLRFLFSMKEINRLIEEAVSWLKKYLAEGHDILGYNEKMIE